MQWTAARAHKGLTSTAGSVKSVHQAPIKTCQAPHDAVSVRKGPSTYSRVPKVSTCASHANRAHSRTRWARHHHPFAKRAQWTCPMDTTSVSGSAKCVTCPPGTFVSLPEGRVEKFVRGYNFCNVFVTRPNGVQIRSKSCYANDYPRATRCTKCRQDTFSSKKNAPECIRCARVLSQGPGRPCASIVRQGSSVG